MKGASLADPQTDSVVRERSTIAALTNIASYLPFMAAAAPDRPAVVVTRSRTASGRPVYATLTYDELERMSSRYANGLSSVGITRGMRVLVMVQPGFDFVGLIFALFKIGAAPVMIDPGMGIGRLLDCIRRVDLDAFVGVPLAQAVRIFRPGAFRTVRHVLTVGRRWFWGGPTLHELCDCASESFTAVDTRPTDTAAILFTSGSTGPAKGVVYEHGMFDAQVRMIQSYYGIEPGGVDLPAFPLFALFSTAMGMTAVIPEMDPSRPARVNPAHIVEAIRDHGVTNTFGSPAIWERVAAYCHAKDIKLPTLRRVLIAGAPVRWTLIDRLRRVLSDGADVHTPYGATESLPVSSIRGREVLAECREKTRNGAGTCVGHPLPGIEVRMIRITDEPIPKWSDDLLAPDGEIGEIVVSGPVVTKEYLGLPEANALAKIRDGERVWHRMGDLGYRDERGCLWFAGRKSQRVTTTSGTMFTDCCEGVFNEHPDVARSALVGIGRCGRQTPVVVIEPKPGRYPCGPRFRTFTAELLDLFHSVPRIPHSPFGIPHSLQHVLFRRRLPVDIRHNAKIDREALAEWAARRVP